MLCNVQLWYETPEAEESERFGPFSSASAFEAFYGRYGRPLWSYLHHMSGEAATSEDLAQEAFMKLVQKAPEGLSESAMRAYLYKIATSLIIDLWRRRKAERGWLVASHSDSTFQEPVTAGHLRSCALSQMNSEISLILRKLHPKERLLVWLAYAEGMEYREIAQVLSLRVTSVKVILYRLRKKISALITSKPKGSEI